MGMEVSNAPRKNSIHEIQAMRLSHGDLELMLISWTLDEDGIMALFADIQSNISPSFLDKIASVWRGLFSGETEATDATPEALHWRICALNF